MQIVMEGKTSCHKKRLLIKSAAKSETLLHHMLLLISRHLQEKKMLRELTQKETATIPQYHSKGFPFLNQYHNLLQGVFQF
jgi:hypothetical protein